MRRSGADPPKNEAGTTGAVSSLNQIRRRVSAGNGLRIWKADEIELTYAVVVLECCNDVVHEPRFGIAPYDNGKGWPDTSLAFWPCSKVADSGDVVTQKRCFAIFDTQYITPPPSVLTYRIQMFLGGQRRGVRRLLPGLHCTGLPDGIAR